MVLLCVSYSSNIIQTAEDSRCRPGNMIPHIHRLFSVLYLKKGRRSETFGISASE